MTNKEKKVVISSIGIMVVILLVVVGVKLFNKPSNEGNVEKNQVTENVQNEEKYTTELSDGTKLNNSEDLNKLKTYKTIQISNIQFTSKNGSSVLLADLKNTGSSEFAREEVKVSIIGENNEVLTTITAVIPRIATGETKQLNAVTTADIANAKDFKIGE